MPFLLRISDMTLLYEPEALELSLKTAGYVAKNAVFWRADSTKAYNENWYKQWYTVYDDFDEVYHELRGLFLKPLVCTLLLANKVTQLAFGLVCLLLDGMTCHKHWQASAANVGRYALNLIGYLLLTAVTAVTVLPIFLLRCLLTISNCLLSMAQSQGSQNSSRTIPKPYNLEDDGDLHENESVEMKDFKLFE